MELKQNEIDKVRISIEENFNGDKDLFFEDLRNKTIFVMIFMAVSYIFSYFILMIGKLPIFTLILGTLLLYISIKLVKYYNMLHKYMYN